MRRLTGIVLVAWYILSACPTGVAAGYQSGSGDMCCTWGEDLGTGPGSDSDGAAATGGSSAAISAWVVGTPGGGVRPPSGGVTCTGWRPASEVDPSSQPTDVGGFKVDPDGVTAILYFRDCGSVRQWAWVRQESPEVMARLALRDIQEELLRAPELFLSPPGRGFVNLETWLAVADIGAQSATASIPGRSVTVTATIASTTWVLDVGDGNLTSLVCEGPGVAWQPAFGDDVPAPCGLTATVASPPGSSPMISALITWDVSWRASNGATGSLDPIESAAALVSYRIDEIQTIGTRG